MRNEGAGRGSDQVTEPRRNAILIAGPTASGKSALAIELARQHDAVIINTDSMQVYDVLRVITARPDPDEMARAQHHLFGHVSPLDAYSTGRWLADVRTVLSETPPDRRVIFAGGTGLYFNTLLQGLSPMPDIPQQVRDRWRYRLHEEGAQRLHRVLRREDPETAMQLAATDGQRIARALEILEVSGKSITYWQAQSGVPLVDGATVDARLILPDRAVLYERINRRFETMVERGALEEVRALLALKPDPALPAMKAIGVPELSDHLSGTLALEEATSRACMATRRYAKRQMTWFRNQLKGMWSISGR